MGSVAVAFWVVSFVACAVGAQPQSSLPPGYIMIDGRKTPEQIPEYLTWQTGFNTIGFLRTKNVTDGPMTFLQKLSSADRNLLFAEVERHRARSEQCQRRGESLVEKIKDDLVKLEKEMKANTLECRTRLLDSKDRMLSRMSADGALTLTGWMIDERRKVQSIMPKSELEFYRLPR